MRGENPGSTLQPTVLVHEAFLRLVAQDHVAWQNRAQFFAIASQILRRILVDQARARHRLKRGGDALRVTWIEDLAVGRTQGVDLMALDEALERLSKMDEVGARIVELRFFAGLSIEETAEALGSSPATVKREWGVARAWLRRELASIVDRDN